MQLLLVSNSQCFGRGYLDHAESVVKRHFANAAEGGTIAFVPFAVHDQQGYGERVTARLAELDLHATTVTPDQPGVDLLSSASGVFVGGGNTFRLLDQLRRQRMLTVIRDRVASGVSYMGSSAGSGIAAPTIKTSNDMPIVQPDSFDSLGLVDYQLNLHYIDADPGSQHMGETRQKRLEEYLEENQTPVVALREGAWIEVRGEEHRVGGETGGLVFQRESEPLSLVAGDRLVRTAPSSLAVAR